MWATVYGAGDGVDFVLHQAALPSMPRSISNHVTASEVKVMGTIK